MLCMLLFTVLNNLTLRPPVAEANPVTASIDVGTNNACAANFIRPCPWNVNVNYVTGEDITQPWSLTVPPGFFFALDNEVNDQSYVGYAFIRASVQGNNQPCHLIALAQVNLYEATTNTAATVTPQAAIAIGADGLPVGVNKVPDDASEVFSLGPTGRYYGSDPGDSIGVSLVISQNGNGFDVTRHIYLGGHPAAGETFCVQENSQNATDEAYFLQGLTDDTSQTAEVEGDELTDTCYKAGATTWSLNVLGTTFTQNVNCTVIPRAPAVAELPIPNPLPRESIKAGFPRFGQHGKSICWAVAAADNFWWLAAQAANGDERLVREPGRPAPNSRYRDLDIGSMMVDSQTDQGPFFDDAAGYRRLIRRVVQSAWDDFGGNHDGLHDPNEHRVFLDAIPTWDYYLALDKLIESANVPLRVHAITTGEDAGCLTGGTGPQFPPGIVGAQRAPTLNDYEIELARGQAAVVGIPQHVVAAVGYCLTGPFTQDVCKNAPAGACPCLVIADGNHAPEHNNDPSTADYDYWRLADSSVADPFSPLIVDSSLGVAGVVLLLFISPRTDIPASATPTRTPTPTVTLTPQQACTSFAVGRTGATSATLLRGRSAQNTITVSVSVPSDATWTFTAQGAPAGVTVQFSPSSFSGTGQTTATISVGPTAVDGTSTIQLDALCNGQPSGQGTFSFALTVATKICDKDEDCDTPTPGTLVATPTGTLPAGTPTLGAGSPAATTSPTGTRSASATVTLTATAASPTATRPSLPPSGVGGRGFGVSPTANGALATWQGGAGQTGFAIGRFTNGAWSVVAVLGPTATSYTDTTAPAGVSCYWLLALGTSPQGTSDLECVDVGTPSGPGAPRDVTVRLNQSFVATLTWSPPAAGGQDSYELVELGGGAQPLAAGATSVSVPVSGFTCFVLQAKAGGVVQGSAPGVCVAPGFSNLLL